MGKRYGVGELPIGDLAVRVGVGVRGDATVEVGNGVELGVHEGSRQAGMESTRAEGSRVYPN